VDLIILDVRHTDARHFSHPSGFGFEFRQAQKPPKKLWNVRLLIFVQSKIKNGIMTITYMLFSKAGFVDRNKGGVV